MFVWKTDMASVMDNRISAGTPNTSYDSSHFAEQSSCLIIVFGQGASFRKTEMEYDMKKCMFSGKPSFDGS